MHILHVTPWYHPSIGGVASVLESLTRYEVDNNHKVSVLTQMPKEGRPVNVHTPPLRENQDGVDVYRFYPRGLEPISRWKRHKLIKEIEKIVAKIHSKDSIDVIHILGIFLFTRPVARMAETLNVPKVMSLYGEEFSFFRRKSTYSHLRSYFFRKKVTQLLRGMTGFTASGSDLKKNVNQLAPNVPCSVVLNGVDYEDFRPASAEERQRWREEEGLAQDVPVTVTVSCYGGRKGGLNYAEVFAALKKHRTEARHILVGDGDELPVIEAYCRQHGLHGNLLVKGCIPHDQLRKFYGLSDIYLQLPRWESGVSMSTVEAQLMGLPVVVTDTEAMSDSISPETKASYCFALEAIDDTALSLKELIDCSEKRKSLGQEARRWFLEKADEYSGEGICASYLKVFTDCQS